MKLNWNDDAAETIACLEEENREIMQCLSIQQKELDKKRSISGKEALKTLLEKTPHVIKNYAKKVLRLIKKRTEKLIFGSSTEGRHPLPWNRNAAVDGVSVVIPTYNDNRTIDCSVQSVLEQSFHDMEVLVVVNGENEAWFQELGQRYSGEARIRVLYTPTLGAAAARNIGLKEASREGIMFLDDDDYFTSGYVLSLLSLLGKDVEFVQGRISEDLNAEKLSYIDEMIKKAKGGAKEKSPFNSVLFSTVTGKLFRTSTLRNNYERFDERFLSLEDINFWLSNYGNIHKRIAYQSIEVQEAYMRRMREDSVSRPKSEKSLHNLFSAFLYELKHVETILFDPNECFDTKQFASQMAFDQNHTISNIFHDLTEEQKERVSIILKAEDSPFLNRGLFSSKTGIAFCHNFSPTIDPSAIVAPKRLKEIDSLEGEPIRWTVISKDMSSIRSVDTRYVFFYSRFLYASQIMIKGIVRELPKNQYFFGRIAYQKAKEIEATVIYSRSMFPGSHIAAYLYKLKHKEVKWYAEFSDPLLYNTFNTERKSICEEDDDAILHDFWSSVEEMVYENADVIIFTNENQRQYMLSYNRTHIANSLIEQKSMVSHHPIMDHRFANVIVSKYSLPKGINIAYFGSLPKYRNRDLLIQMLDNPRVHLHIFTVMTKDMSGLKHDRIHLNTNVDYLQFLNIASRMDYLVVIDSENVSDINPWLPSKVSDYIASGTPIIAIVKAGSTLSQMDDPQFIIKYDIDHAFVSSL